MNFIRYYYLATENVKGKHSWLVALWLFLGGNGLSKNDKKGRTLQIAYDKEQQ